VTELLHELLARSANRKPQATAIQEKDTLISYAELYRRVCQTANLLSQSGVKRHARVALLVHKSASAYQGIYSILQSGGAYVPLDRRAPADRLAYICDDCEIETLVVTQVNWGKLKQVVSQSKSIKRVLVVDNAEPESVDGIQVMGSQAIDQQPESPQQAFNGVDSDLAYILYTSGSTGQPKGVMISHHVSMSFVRWACQHASLTDADRVSGHAPLHFDLSIFDIFASAMAGATLLPVPDGASTFPSRLLDWMVNNRISVWYSVPSILSMMAQHKNFDSQDFSHLRLLIFAGEVFPVPYLKLWLNRLPDLTFMNWYGPTETNVITSYTVTLSANELVRPLPIGKTTTNADLYCLDENGQLVTEPGVSGELFARGPCVALGYWGDEEKTQAKFLANANQPWLQDRTFKTGDIVSLDENGDYIFQGRNDHMVKCRGYRIELGEVEAAFYQESSVVEAVVIPIPDELIGNKLIACVVTEKAQSKDFDLANDAKPELVALNQSVSQFLPAYMVPSETKLLGILPKTSNGKIDRQTLTKQILANEI